MKRRLLNLLTALSLLLCVAACSLWVRSYWWYDIVGVGVGSTSLGAHSLGGSLTCEVRRDGAFWSPVPWARRDSFQAGHAAGSSMFDFGYAHQVSVQKPPTWRVFVVWTPHWLTALITLPLPMFRGAKFVRRHRWLRRAMCPQCGYDLRATPGRCPECGYGCAATYRSVTA